MQLYAMGGMYLKGGTSDDAARVGACKASHCTQTENKSFGNTAKLNI